MSNYTTYHFPAVESDLLLDELQRVRITIDGLESFITLVVHSIEFQRCICTTAVPTCVNSGPRFANVDYASLSNHLPSVNQSLHLAVNSAKMRLNEIMVASQCVNSVNSGTTTINSSRISNSTTRNSIHHHVSAAAPAASVSFNGVQSLIQKYVDGVSVIRERRSSVPLYSATDGVNLMCNDSDDFINISIQRNSPHEYSPPCLVTNNRADCGSKSEGNSHSDSARIVGKGKALVSNCVGDVSVGGLETGSNRCQSVPTKKQIPKKIPGIPFVLIVRVIIQEPGFAISILFPPKRKPLEEWRIHCILTDSDIISFAACTTPSHSSTADLPQNTAVPKTSIDTSKHSEVCTRTSRSTAGSNSNTKAESVPLRVGSDHKHHKHNHKDTILSNDPLQITDLLAFIEVKSFDSFCVNSVAEGKLICSMKSENLIFDVLFETE